MIAVNSDLDLYSRAMVEVDERPRMPIACSTHKRGCVWASRLDPRRQRGARWAPEGRQRGSVIEILAWLPDIAQAPRVSGRVLS